MTKNKVLMVAFDYPPSKSVAGQRTLRMTQYLPDFDWEPIVLTGSEKAYDGLDYSQKIPEHMRDKVFRSGALDVDKHMSYKGKHFAWMKVLDRWSTWIPGAIIKGIKIIKQHNPTVIWSTYPTLSGHIVAYYLAKKFNLPLVVDYQDPLSYIHKNPTGLQRWTYLKVDNTILPKAAAAVFATEQAKEAYAAYHFSVNKNKFHCIENGYDESNFQTLMESKKDFSTPFSNRKFSFYYSGVLYPNGRNPLPTLKAISDLKLAKKINTDNFELIFQGAGNGQEFDQVLKDLKIRDLVHFFPSVPFLDSLYNMQHADALLLIQDSVFKLQVPGKLFEYIRAGKPVLVAAPDDSATAIVAKEAQCGSIRNTAEGIREVLIAWLDKTFIIPKDRNTYQYSRYEKARQLSLILNQVSGNE